MFSTAGLSERAFRRTQGSPFDFDTPITDDLTLNAQWKHVHSYTCVPLDYEAFGDALSQYYDKYLSRLHVRFCSCDDVKLEAHTFKNGVCTGCGYTKPGATEVQLKVSYWQDGDSRAWLNELPRTVKRDNEVIVSAYYFIDDYQFSKWQYSTDNGASWVDLVDTLTVGFIIPCSMQVRAIYIDPLKYPQVSLSARSYEVEAQGWFWDSVLFQMEYKLPKGYVYVDSGVRSGDNQGISYYAIKKRKTNITNALWNWFVDGVNAVTDFILTGPLIGDDEKKEVPPDYVIEERENSVLNEMSAGLLSRFMYESKPINIPQYEPIYWQTNATSKGRSGSVNTLTPLRFIQKNNGKHIIYGIAYLRYKTPDGKIETIYTDALPVTRDSVPSYSVTIDAEGMIKKAADLEKEIEEKKAAQEAKK